MHKIKRLMDFAFIGLLLVTGAWLLFQRPTLAPETTTRQQSLLQAYAPAGNLAGEEGSPIEPGQRTVNPVVSPVVVDFADVKISTEDPDSMYNRWLRGDLDLDENDGIVSDVEMQKMVEEALNMPPSKNVQLATSQPAALAPVSSGVAFDSMDYTDGGGSVPPDPEMAAGPNHVIATVNVAVAIYDKSTGTAVLGPTTAGSLFSQLPCTTGLYDPNVIYDEEAQRWFLAYDQGPESAAGGYCVLVSQTSDPTGLWNEYFFQTNSSGGWMDYPHAGVGDEYIFMGGNIFGISGGFIEGRIYAFNKVDLYAGNPVTMITQGLGGGIDTPQPLNLHGFSSGTWPTFGSTHYFLGEPYDGVNYTLLEWDTTTLINHGNINLGAGGLPVDSVQSGGGTLQGNDFRPLDFEYRNGYGWTAMTISCNPGSGTVNCVRWAQIDLASSTPPTLGPAGSGVYASEGDYRTFPDLAVNACGAMAIGYTKTNANSYPGVWVTGRRNGDPANMLQAESQVKAGEITYTAFDPAPRRWGDYTGMTIDPDGLTFWYLGQYSKDTGTTDGRWGTYIASFNYGGDCTEATIAGKVTDSSSGDPITDASVELSASSSVLVPGSTDANGDYVLAWSAGTYDVTASAYGYTSQTVTNITTIDGVTTTQNFALSVAPSYTVSGIVTDAATGWPLYARIDIPEYPGSPVWTDPETGAYSVTLAGGIAYNFTVSAWVDGYTNATRTVGPLTGSSIQNFALTANAFLCTAPGYTGTSTAIFNSSFETAFTADGWDQVDTNGTSGTWTRPASGTNPTASPHTGNRMAMFNSYLATTGHQTRLYRTSGLDLSSYTSPEASFWLFNGSCGFSGNDTVQLQVSTNGGSTWNNVGAPVPRQSAGGWQQHSFDISSYAGAGMTDVRLALLGTSGFGCNIYIDDVAVVENSCTPTSGGLVLGNVYDANTTAGINGAAVSNQDGYNTTSAATPTDPNVDDGFYTLFSPVGSKTFTASAPYYADDVDTVTVVANDITQHDFFLDAGQLSYTPAALEATIPAETSTIKPFTITNNGSAAANFQLLEISGSTSDVLQDGGFEGGIPNSDWNEASTNFGTPICDLGSCGADVARSGTYWLWLGGANSTEIGSVDQDVVIPTGAATLAFWLLLGDSGAVASMDVSIDGDVLFSVTEADAATYVTYTEVTMDVSAYADGNSHNLRFESTEYGTASSNFNFHVDDVSLLVDSGLPWLSESPASGTIAATTNQPIDITFDATGLVPGQYIGQLTVAHDTPSVLQNVPITLTVVTGYLWNGSIDTDWDEPTNWTPNGVPSGFARVSIDPVNLFGARVWPVLNVDATVFDLSVEADAELTIPNGRSLTINGTLTNNGLLRQTIDNVNGATTFLSMGGYGGVEINPSGNMGETVVEIRGNQDCTINPTSPHVQRCFDIDPSTPQTATIRFYYALGEANGNPEGGVSVYHWNGASWDLEAGTHSHSIGADPRWVQVTGVDEYSPFVLDIGTPTAVSLSQFTTGGSATGTAVLLIISFVTLMLFSMIIMARRKR